MKQSKRMLSVLLAILMICSTFTIGAQALKANIDSPAYGYDEVLDPVISSEQAARMILDEIEPLLADMDIDEKVAGLEIKIKSIDTLLDTVHNLGDSTLVGIAKALANLGDIEKISFKAGDVEDHDGHRCRRGNSTSTDFEVLGAVLTFLETNADYIAKFAYNGFDFGWLDGLGVFGNDDLAALNDVHGLVVTLVDKLLAGEDFEIDIEHEYNTTKTLDGIIQDFIDNKFVKLVMDLFAEDGGNEIAELFGLGEYIGADGELTQDIPTTKLFPSLTDGNLGKLSFSRDSFYNFLIKIVKAAVNDVVIPKAGELLGDLIDDDIAGVIDAVVEILELDVDLSVCVTAKEKIDTLLNYMLVDGGLKKFFLFKEATSPTGVTVKYLSIADGFWTKLTGIIKIVLPMLPPLLGDDCPNFDKTDAELSALGTDEMLTYIIQRVLEKFVDGVEFADDCKTIKELASRTLIEVCKDLMPEKNFEEEFEAGRMVYDSDDCLTLAAYVARYYLNGETTIQDNTDDANMNLTAMLNTAADWALAKVGSIFSYDPSKHTNDSVWSKLFCTVFQAIPLNIFVGAAPVSTDGGKQIFKPGIPDSATGLQNLILDDIVGGILEFNITEGSLDEVGITGINKILSLIGSRSDSDLNKPIPQLLIDLVARIINPLFGLSTESAAGTSDAEQLKLIIPYTYESLDSLVTANKNTSSLSLTNTIYRLCKNIGFINKGVNSLFYTGCPLIAKLMGLWGDDDEKYVYRYISSVAPSDFNGGRQYNFESLEALYEQYAATSNDGIDYDDPAYSYFHMVDFQPFLYLEFKRVRSDVSSLLSKFKAGKLTVAEFNEEATNAAYRLLTMVDMMNGSYTRECWNGTALTTVTNYGETLACDNQLIKVINKANDLDLVQEEYADGSMKYTDRSWAVYTKAKAFADKVEAEYQAAAEAGDEGLRDLRQSRINTARKMLVDAMANLKSWIPLADYSALDSAIEMAGYTTSLRKYNKKAIQKALNAYLEAINIARDYDMDDQFIVDGVQQALDEAIENFNYEMTDYLELWLDGFGQYVDEDYSYLFGFEEGFASQQAIDEMGGLFNDYMMNYGMATSSEGAALVSDITSTANGNGTGAVIKMFGYDENGEVDYANPKDTKYTVIIFGDVDGDAYSNAMDSTVLRAYCQLKLTEAQFGAPAIYASDANESGDVDTKDAKFIESVGLMKAVANQTPESLIYKTYGILDVLGLREPAQ